MGQVEYCEERLRCRRILLMGHFGEAFDPGRCAKTCDICSRSDRQFQGEHVHPSLPPPIPAKPVVQQLGEPLSPFLCP